jgi:hypothetical protein
MILGGGYTGFYTDMPLERGVEFSQLLSLFLLLLVFVLLSSDINCTPSEHETGDKTKFFNEQE